MSQSTKGYSLVDATAQHKPEMSYQKLGMLLGLLAFIWILCYSAQAQFPSRHILQTYQRIGQNRVSQASLKYARDLAMQTKTTKVSQKQRADIFKKYELVNDIQHNICVLLIHKQGEQNWMKSIKSIIAQDYTEYRVYYFNNYESGREIYKHMDDNALDKNKIKVIQNIPNSDYIKQFASAKNYCDRDSIVIYMHDNQRFIGNNVFIVLNAFYRQNPNLKLLYTSYLVGEDKGKNSQYKISRDVNAYPQQIIKQNRYSQYPYLMNGLIVFKQQLLNQITQPQLYNQKQQPFQYTQSVVFGMSLLNVAKQNILYVPQPFIFKQKQSNIISTDTNIRKQLKQIANKYVKD